MTHPRADTVLTDQEADDTRDHHRELLDATPTLRGGIERPGTNPPAVAAAAARAGAHPPTAAPVLAAVGGLATLAIDSLTTALTGIDGARALMEDLTPADRLPSAAFAHIAYAREAVASAITDLKREHQR